MEKHVPWAVALHNTNKKQTMPTHALVNMLLARPNARLCSCEILSFWAFGGMKTPCESVGTPVSRLVWLVVIVGGLVLSLFAADLVPKTRQLVAFQSEGLRPNDSCPMLRRFRAKGEINPHTGRRYPLVLLYSFEGSGNTWTRTLLEQATGVYTGSMYKDRTLYWMGLYGESIRNSAVVAVKSHFSAAPAFNNSHLANISRVLTVVRNPFQALVAERKRLIAATVTYWNSHVMTPQLVDFTNGRAYFGINPDPYQRTSILPWDDWVRVIGLPMWKRTVRLAMEWEGNHTVPVKTIRYEDMKANTEGAVREMLVFLELDPGMAKCIHGSSIALVQRTGATESQRIRLRKDFHGRSSHAKLVPLDTYPDCLYSPELVDHVMTDARELMEHFGYSPPTACAPKSAP